MEKTLKYPCTGPIWYSKYVHDFNISTSFHVCFGCLIILTIYFTCEILPFGAKTMAKIRGKPYLLSKQTNKSENSEKIHD